MYVTIWRFRALDPAAFERHYGPDGTWVRLFRKSAEYVRSDLLKSPDGYLTLDWWTSRAAYDAFRRTYAAEYADVDFACEHLAASEEKLGDYELIGG